MRQSVGTIRCPVCHMTEIDCSLSLNYRGIDYHFCSHQCLERFQSRPQLFVGNPQQGLSAKQMNQEVLKKRHIRFSHVIGDALRNELAAALSGLMGINDWTFESQDLYVIYDLLQVSLEDIEKTIQQAEVKFRGGVLDTLKRGLIHYTEDCELDNIAHLTGGGCH